MNSEELSSLCSSLALEEEEETLTPELAADLQAQGEYNIDRSLVGCVLSTSPIARDAFIHRIKGVWKTKERFEVEAIGSNKFVFHFISTADKRRVLSGGPWSYQNKLLVLEEPTGAGDYSKMSFTKAPFWIQLHNIPVFCMSMTAGGILGHMVGKVLEVECNQDGLCLGTFIRVRTIIDISKPLKRILKVRLGTNNELITILLRYEHLPELCFHCGIIGHPIKECPEREALQGDVSKLKYGSWIRAPPTLPGESSMLNKRRRPSPGTSNQEPMMGNSLHHPTVAPNVHQTQFRKQPHTRATNPKSLSSQLPDKSPNQSPMAKGRGKGNLHRGLDLHGAGHIQVLASSQAADRGKLGPTTARGHSTSQASTDSSKTGLPTSNPVQSLVQPPAATPATRTRWLPRSTGSSETGDGPGTKQAPTPLTPATGIHLIPTPSPAVGGEQSSGQQQSQGSSHKVHMHAVPKSPPSHMHEAHYPVTSLDPSILIQTRHMGGGPQSNLYEVPIAIINTKGPSPFLSEEPLLSPLVDKATDHSTVTTNVDDSVALCSKEKFPPARAGVGHGGIFGYSCRDAPKVGTSGPVAETIITPRQPLVETVSFGPPLDPLAEPFCFAAKLKSNPSPPSRRKKKTHTLSQSNCGPLSVSPSKSLLFGRLSTPNKRKNLFSGSYAFPGKKSKGRRGAGTDEKLCIENLETVSAALEALPAPVGDGVLSPEISALPVEQERRTP